VNHHPTSRYRRAIVTASVAGLLLAAACGEDKPTVQTEAAPEAPETAQRELDDLEDYYRESASDVVPQADPFALNVEERTAPQSAEPIRPANGPRPY
jgi:hypothetical protein